MTREDAVAHISEVLQQLTPSERHNVLIDQIELANRASEQNERDEFEARRARIIASRQAARRAPRDDGASAL